MDNNSPPHPARTGDPDTACSGDLSRLAAKGQKEAADRYRSFRIAAPAMKIVTPAGLERLRWAARPFRTGSNGSPPATGKTPLRDRLLHSILKEPASGLRRRAALTALEACFRSNKSGQKRFRFRRKHWRMSPCAAATCCIASSAQQLASKYRDGLAGQQDTVTDRAYAHGSSSCRRLKSDELAAAQAVAPERREGAMG